MTLHTREYYRTGCKALWSDSSQSRVQDITASGHENMDMKKFFGLRQRKTLGCWQITTFINSEEGAKVPCYIIPYHCQRSSASKIISMMYTVQKVSKEFDRRTTITFPWEVFLCLLSTAINVCLRKTLVYPN
jgi:hypothetical protein